MLLFVVPVWLLWLSITWRRTSTAQGSVRLSLFALITLACLALGTALNQWIIASKLSGLDTVSGIAAMHRASLTASILLGSSCALALAFFLIAFLNRQRE